MVIYPGHGARRPRHTLLPSPERARTDERRNPQGGTAGWRPSPGSTTLSDGRFRGTASAVPLFVSVGPAGGVRIFGYVGGGLPACRLPLIKEDASP